MKVYKIIFLLSSFSFTTQNFAQNVIDWDGKYQLQLSDFRAKTTQIGDVSIYSLHSSTNIGFVFNMSNYEFMFTKNFNSKVSCTFTRDLASILAPDTATAHTLVKFARYEFDLAELYARKFRKKLYEEKGAFSNSGFFRPLYDSIQKEYIERYDIAGKETEIGKDETLLNQLHSNVLKEIQELSEFCRDCKPTKKKK